MFNLDTVKLGRKAIKLDTRTLKLARYFTSELPPPPPTCDWSKGTTSWGMMDNDTLGDCVVGEALTHSPDARLGYRVPYNGPVITFTTDSGNVLTVTPNHPMLTPSGFVLAKNVHQGDDLVSTGGAQIFPRTGRRRSNLDIDDAPIPIEQVVSSLRLGRSAIREIMPLPIHFHGDGEFVNGNIEVIGADSFLRGKYNASLCEPYTKNKIGTASKLKRHLQSFSPTLQRFGRSFSASFGNIGLRCNGLAFSSIHTGIPQPYSLPQTAQSVPALSNGRFDSTSCNTEFYRESLNRLTRNIAGYSDRKITSLGTIKAGGSLPTGTNRNSGYSQFTSDSITGGAELFSDLAKRHSGLVHADRVVNVEVNSLSGHVYNLSTDSGCYVSNSIVTHNCTCAGVGHATQVWSLNTGTEAIITDAAVLDIYERWCGYNPSDPSTDQGGIELNILNDWKNQGFAGHTILGYASIAPANNTHVQQAIELFGGIYTGVSLPLTAQGQAVWDVVPNSGDNGAAGSWGGHCVYVLGYTATGLTCITWGALQQMTWAFWNEYFDEAYGVLSNDWLAATGAPNGFNLTQLQQDLGQIN